MRAARYMIVAGLENICIALDHLLTPFDRLLDRLPRQMTNWLFGCRFAWWSYRLDQRWQTGYWQPPLSNE